MENVDQLLVLLNLAKRESSSQEDRFKGIAWAGFCGQNIRKEAVESLEKEGFISRNDQMYELTERGREYTSNLLEYANEKWSHEESNLGLLGVNESS